MKKQAKRILSTALALMLLLALFPHRAGAIKAGMNEEKWDLTPEQAKAYSDVIKAAETRFASEKNSDWEVGADAKKYIYSTLFDIDGNTLLWICGIQLYRNEKGWLFPREIGYGEDYCCLVSFEELWEWDGARAVPFSVVSDYRAHIDLMNNGILVYIVYGGTGVGGEEWSAFYPFSGGKISKTPEWCSAWGFVDDYTLKTYNISSKLSKKECFKKYLNVLTSSGKWPDLPYNWKTTKITDYGYGQFSGSVSGGAYKNAGGVILSAKEIAKENGCWIDSKSMISKLSNYSSSLAYPYDSKIIIDGKEVQIKMFQLRDENGNGTNYVRVRDLAALLNGTAAQFEVGYKSGKVRLTSKTPYTGATDSAPFTGEEPYTVFTNPTVVDGEEIVFDAFQLHDAAGGYTYYKLRDLGKALGFNVTNKGKTPVIETDKPYVG